ncbi:MAG: PIN domain-containing protein [Armatimonadota bacterium]
MKAGSKPFAIDANVILRYLLQDNEELTPKADAIIEGVEDGKLQVLCEPVTLSEVVYVLFRFYEQERSVIYKGLEPIVKMDGFLMPDKSRYIHALELFANDIPHFGDACACAAALEQCKGRLLSFDRKLSSVNGVSRFEEPEK